MIIDIHTHILPGIDDGAQNLKESIQMARTAYESGVKTVFVTPHCNIVGNFDNYYDESLREAYLELKEALHKEQIPIQLVLGMEVYATEEVPELLQCGKIITLNKSRYLLLEFGFRIDISLMDYLIREVTELGYELIIAHPERYPYVQKNPEMVYSWLEKGCYIQINKGSVLGGFGDRARKTALYFLNYGVVSFLASDAHSPDIRTTDMSRVYDFILSNYGGEYAKLLFEVNPIGVMENRKLTNFCYCRDSEGTGNI